MIFFFAMQMIELGLADESLIDELMELTAQSIGELEIQEHFNIVKEIGRGKYGKVLLVTHRFRGNTVMVLGTHLTHIQNTLCQKKILLKEQLDGD